MLCAATSQLTGVPVGCADLAVLLGDRPPRVGSRRGRGTGGMIETRLPQKIISSVYQNKFITYALHSHYILDHYIACEISLHTCRTE